MKWEHVLVLYVFPKHWNGIDIVEILMYGGQYQASMCVCAHQWETTLQCNIIFHWLDTYTKWFLQYCGWWWWVEWGAGEVGWGGGHLDINIISYNIAIPIIKIRQSHNHLIFIMGISIPRRQSVLCLYWNRAQYISSHGIHLFCKEYSVTHLNSV